ncbi:MAG: adenine phosphoribosyltransferase [Verrucomicrobia bacterium]|nr:adenine phosphoribosyltransferase [Verrucomicrobiota bacterium]
MSEAIPTVEDIRSRIRNIPDFPKPGIQFKDITPVLADPRLLAACVDMLTANWPTGSIDIVAGIEARGFIFGAACATKLGAGFVPIRKKGKLPAETIEATYDLEYGQNTIAVHKDAITPGQHVLLIDDLLATGGTARAAASLIDRLGGKLMEIAFLIELEGLGGRSRLADRSVRSVIRF